MASSHTSLNAAATDRKARLANLASLKRKQPGSDVTISISNTSGEGQADVVSKTDGYLSGRNYDIVSKAPKLGFENAPNAESETVEEQAKRIDTDVKEKAIQDELQAEKGLDLFKLQPKKPNWDLKRDLAEKMKILDIRTQNAIAKLVRERIENAKTESLKKNASDPVRDVGDEGEEIGIEGNALVEVVHLREKEEEDEERRERELEEEEDGVP